MSVVPGDPASLSACAATAASVGHRLAAVAAALGPEVAALGEGWPGRVSVLTRRRGDALATSAAPTAAELERVGRLLQDRATDLADLHARARSLEERAAAAGFVIRDDHVVPAYGVRGEADAATEAAERAGADALGSELELLLAQHRRRRDFLLAELRDSTERLATLAHGLRRG